MPYQDALQWKPGTCGCLLYIRQGANGSYIFLDSASVRAEQQARIDMGDTTVYPKLAPPQQVCPRHARQGYTPSQGLLDRILQEQPHKARIGA